MNGNHSSFVFALTLADKLLKISFHSFSKVLPELSAESSYKRIGFEELLAEYNIKDSKSAIIICLIADYVVSESSLPGHRLVFDRQQLGHLGESI